MDRLTPAAISELHSEKGWDENVYGDSQESSLATRSRMPVEIALSPLPMMAIVERRSESVVSNISLAYQIRGVHEDPVSIEISDIGDK